MITRLVISRVNGISAWSKAWRHNKTLGQAVRYLRAGDLVVRTGLVDTGFERCLHPVVGAVWIEVSMLDAWFDDVQSSPPVG